MIFGGTIYYLMRICTFWCRQTEPQKEDEQFVANKLKVGLGIASVALMMLMFILSTSMGNYALSEKSKGLVDIPRGFQDICTNLEPEVTELVRDTAARVIAPGMMDLNRTINRGVNVAEMVHSMVGLNSSLDNLPDIKYMVSLLNEIRNLTEGNSTQERIDDLLMKLDNFSTIDADTRTLMDSLESFLSDVNASVVGFLSAVDYANSTLNVAEVLMKRLIGGGDEVSPGLVNGVRNDLVAIQRAPDGSLPSSDTFVDVSDGSYGTTPRLVASTMNGNSVEISTMNDRLIAIYGNLSSLPNYTETSAKIIELNNTARDALSPNGVLNNITRALQMLETEVQEFPDLSIPQQDLTTFYNKLVQAMDDFEDGIESLNYLIDLFADIPSDLEYLLSVVESLSVVNDIRGALFTVKKQLESVNATIIELPSGLNDIQEAFDKFNSSLADISNETESMRNDIHKANDTVVGYLEDGRGYSQDMADVLDTINSTIKTYDIAAINASLSDAAAMLRTVNFTDTLISVDDLEVSLSALHFGEDLVLALNTFQKTLQSVVSLLRRDVDPSQGDYLTLAKGYCSNDDSISCSVNGDCAAGGVCVGFGVYRCASHGGTTCTDDSDCTPDSYCLADHTRANELHAYMLVLASNSLDVDVSSELSQLDDVLGVSDLNLDGARSDMTTALEGTQTIDEDEMTNVIADIRDGLVDYNASGALADLEFNFEDFGVRDVLDQVEPFEQDIDDLLNNYRPKINKYITLALALETFLFNSDQLHARLEAIGESTLNAVWQAGGPLAMIQSMLVQVDLVSLFFNTSQHAVTFDRTSIADKVDKERYEVLDKMGGYEVSGYGDMKGNGAVYYFMRLFNISTTLADTPHLSGIYVDSNNERYPDNNECIASKCEDHTFDVLNTAPMSDWQYEFPQVEAMTSLDGVNYSREEMLVYLWVTIWIIIALSIITLILHFIPSCQKVESVTNCCLFSCIWCHLPILLLFTAILLVLSLSISDACYRGPEVLEPLLHDSLCDDIRGDGTLTDCKYNHAWGDSLGGGNLTVNANLKALYRGFLLADCPSTDPFKAVIQQVADAVHDLPENIRAKRIGDMDLQLREPMINITELIAANTGDLIRDFLYDVSRSTLSCNRVSEVFVIAQQETCASYTDTLVWIIAPWYFCSWILLCCALPSSCMKRKVVDYAQAQAASAEDEEEDEEDEVEALRRELEASMHARSGAVSMRSSRRSDDSDDASAAENRSMKRSARDVNDVNIRVVSPSAPPLEISRPVHTIGRWDDNDNSTIRTTETSDNRFRTSRSAGGSATNWDAFEQGFNPHDSRYYGSQSSVASIGSQASGYVRVRPVTMHYEDGSSVASGPGRDSRFSTTRGGSRKGSEYDDEAQL